MDKKCIMVLGMHRAGTSALAGVLDACGVNMGCNLMPPAGDNPKGYFEDMEVVRVNERLLQSFGMPGSWDSVLMLDDDWLSKKGVLDLLEDAVDVVRKEYDGALVVGMKDPRICHFIPFWQRALMLAGYESVIVSIHRSPLEIAASLEKRNGIHMDRGILLWARHILDFERDSIDFRRCFVWYDTLLGQPEMVITDIQESLGVTFPRTYQDSKNAIRGFLSADLRHHESSSADLHNYPETIGRLSRLVYEVASGLIPDGAYFRGELESIRHEHRFWLWPASMSHWCSYNEKPKLYTDDGTGFSEESAIVANKVQRDGSLVVADFDVARDGINRVRLDPAEGYWIRIVPIEATAYLVDGKKKALDWLTAMTNRSGESGGWWMFDTTDPMILWDAGAGVRALTFKYHQEFHSPEGLLAAFAAEKVRQGENIRTAVGERNNCHAEILQLQEEGRRQFERNETYVKAESNRLSSQIDQLRQEIERQIEQRDTNRGTQLDLLFAQMEQLRAENKAQLEEREANHRAEVDRLSAQIDQLRTESRRQLEERAAKHRTEVDRLFTQMDQIRQESRRQIEECEANHRTEVDRLSVQLEQKEADNSRLTDERQVLAASISVMMSSRSYKVGLFVAAPVRFGRRLFGKLRRQPKRSG